MKSAYINHVIILYKAVADGYKIEIDSLANTKEKEKLKELTEKLNIVEDFLIHLDIIKKNIRIHYFQRSKLPDFMWTKKDKKEK